MITTGYLGYPSNEPKKIQVQHLAFHFWAYFLRKCISETCEIHVICLSPDFVNVCGFDLLIYFIFFFPWEKTYELFLKCTRKNLLTFYISHKSQSVCTTKITTRCWTLQGTKLKTEYSILSTHLAEGSNPYGYFYTLWRHDSFSTLDFFFKMTPYNISPTLTTFCHCLFGCGGNRNTNMKSPWTLLHSEHAAGNFCNYLALWQVLQKT